MSELISIKDFIGKNYITRLATFENWQYSHIICPKDLASAGFCYYFRDIVICRECNLVLFKWDSNDKAFDEHKKYKVTCNFIKLFENFDIKVPDNDVIDYWLKSAVIQQYCLLNIHTVDEIKNGLRIRLNTKYRNFSRLSDVLEFFKQIYPTIKTNSESEYNPLTCRICLLNPTNIVFIDCGHFLSCNDCSKKITSCPLCRSNIRINQRVFY